MFFRICQSSAADEDAHTPSKKINKKSMPSILNPFHKKPPKEPAEAGASPPSRPGSPPATAAAVVSPPTSKISKKPPAAIHSGRITARRDFLKVTAQGLGTAESYSNPESLPSLEAAYRNFKHVYARFAETVAVDRLREREYGHLGEREHVCLDYCGFGLFSHWQQVFQRSASSFNLAYISANLPTHALYGTAEEGTIEAYIRRRIMRYMNISEADYSMVFTASRGTAYKLLAESYPFHTNARLLTVFDYESDAVSWMVAAAREKGAKVLTASFKWPNLRVAASDLKYKLQEKSAAKKMMTRAKKKKEAAPAKGLFVFPVQSRVTGAKYSYQWMSQAQANKWHVLLDASALAPKDMDSLALSLFRPEFIVTSFYKVFGADPTGFGCLFIKNSAIQSLHNSSRARGVGMVRIIPSGAANSTQPTPRGEAGGPPPDPERMPDIHELDAEEYMDAADYVDPVSSFSGPVMQFYLDEERNASAVPDRTSGDLAAAAEGYDDGSGRASAPSEGNDERAVRRDPSWGSETDAGAGAADAAPGDDDDSVAQDEVLQRRGGDTSFAVRGASEIEEEDSGPIFPLTRRGQPPDHPSAGAVGDKPSAPDGRARTAGKPGREVAEEDEVAGERGLWAPAANDAATPRGESGHFLDRIQEEEGEESDDAYTPHRQRIGSDEAVSTGGGGNGSAAMGSPLFHSPPEFTDGLGSGGDTPDDEVAATLERVLHESGQTLPAAARPEADKLESNIMFKDDRDHALREGREATEVRFARPGRRRLLSLAQDDFDEGEDDQLGASGTNGRRLQYWSPGEGSSQWADQYAMSVDGSPLSYDNGDGNGGESEGDALDEEGPVVCNGLDHADSQGLNKTNLRLRFLVNWLINALLKLRHPAQIDRQGTNLVHIYGPEVHFDRGASVAFNVFDWNGAPVKTELVQRLADRSNISLGLGTLCHIVYPDGADELPGLWCPDKKGGAPEANGGDGRAATEPPRNSSAGRHERPTEIPVVTAALGFVSTFEDVYRLWAFVAKFLDADFVAREGWRYHSLNQEMVVL